MDPVGSNKNSRLRDAARDTYVISFTQVSVKITTADFSMTDCQLNENFFRANNATVGNICQDII